MENLNFLSKIFDAYFLLGLSCAVFFLTIIIIFVKIYTDWSDPDRPGGPKWCVKPHENKMMHIKKGNEYSNRPILFSSTRYVDDKNKIWNFGDTQSGHTKTEQEAFKQKGFLGMTWLGWPGIYSIHFRHQQWMEWISTPQGREILFRDEETPYLMVQPFEYAMVLKDVEDKNNVPLLVSFTVTIRPINALLPIFGPDDAYGQLQTQCLAKALLFIKEETFANLGADNEGPKKIINDLFSSEICELNKKIPGSLDGKGVVSLLGYEIISAKLDNIVITDPELLKASTAEYKAKENAKAKIAEADGNMQATKKNAEGQEAIFNVQKKYYSDIENIKGAMKVEERKATSNLTTLVEADNNKKTSLII
jgi:hypothetical protein